MSGGPTQFSEYIRSLGFEPPQRLEPGRFVRFATSERHGDDAGWCKLFPDLECGIVGDFRSGQTWTWRQERRSRKLTAQETIALQIKFEREQREAEALREREEREAAERAATIWKQAKDASDDHPYLQARRVRAHGLKVYRGPYAVNSMRCDGALIVPVRNTAGALQTIEFIAANSEKRFLPRGRKSGGHYIIGEPGAFICIAEGYATAAAVHEDTGHAAVVAFDAGNLEPVAKAIRAKFPLAKIIIAADNDESGTGQRAAKQAASAVGALVAIPEGPGKDWNDVHRELGGEAVKRGIEAASGTAAVAALPTRSKFDDLAAPAIDNNWSSPEPLPELPSVPAFDFDVLPGVLRPFVQDIAERMQCPPEFPAVGAVVMIGAAIGRRLGIRPKQYDSWTVVPNVWGMIVGKSGIMKSPALADAIAPLKRMQAKAFEEYENAKTEYEISAKVEKIRAEHAAGEARKALKNDRSADLAAMLQAGADLEAPKPRRYVVNDSTPEALCETLKDNPHGVLCERDELIGLLRSMDKEHQQEARALYLTAADGDKSFTVDRIMRGAARHIEGVCVSIVGSIQPGVLAGYVRETQRSGAGDDGLLQRFGLMVYPDIGREWRNVDRPENRDAKAAVHALIERLCSLAPEHVGAEPAPEGGIPFLRFNEAGQALFVEWLTDLETKIRSGEEHPAVVSHLSKYRKVVPALALINHLCEGDAGAVTERALSRALRFIDVLEAHARRVYSYASRPDLDAAKTILAKLKAGKLSIEFTARDVYRQGWSGLATPEETAAALRVLVDYAYLRDRVEQSEVGGRPSTIYRAHPTTKAAA